MSSFSGRLRRVVARAWQLDAPLTATTLLMLAALAAFSVGLALDPRAVLGAPVWLKPAKFALSIAVYCATLIGVFGALPAFVRTRRVVSWATTLVMLLELGLIAAQAARGTTSHFNVSTPLNAACFALMGTAIVVQTLASVAVAVALFRQPFADRALGWALRWGMVLTLAGAALGGVMTRPSAEQLVELRQGRPRVVGAHTVGAPDGGPGLPVLGWSRDHGDVRSAHFLGLHALQLLPLAALVSRRARATDRQRTRLVWVVSASYAALLGLVLWQALRGRPLLALDTAALGALLTWAALTGAALWRALAGRAPEPAAAAVC